MVRVLREGEGGKGWSMGFRELWCVSLLGFVYALDSDDMLLVMG